MQNETLLKMESDKPVGAFIEAMRQEAARRGFIIHNEDKMAMAQTFGGHGVAVAEGFDLHMIQICKPEKAAKSLAANPERAVLMPKFIMVFTDYNKTQIRFLQYGEEQIRNLLEDEVFPDSLAATYQVIRQMLEAAA